MRARPVRAINLTSDFRKSLRRLPKHIQILFITKEQWFLSDAYDPRLKTHRLHGQLKGYWSYAINHQYRVLFKFLPRSEVAYLDVGTHEIYKR